MALVLCTGVDHAVVTTRKLILQNAGHKVITAMDESSVKTVCQQHSFDVAVIGQTASAKTKRQVMALIRQHCPSAKILELYRFSTGRILVDADSQSASLHWLRSRRSNQTRLRRRLDRLLFLYQAATVLVR